MNNGAGEKLRWEEHPAVAWSGTVGLAGAKERGKGRVAEQMR